MRSPGQTDRRRDLLDYTKLSRKPISSYLRNAAAPKQPRTKTREPRSPRIGPAPRFPSIGAFLPRQFLAFVIAYLRHQFGTRRSFEFYAKGDPDQGVYKMRGDDRADGEVRLALCGDWGTGTDEAYLVGRRIRETKPHYTIHLGDIYYVGDVEEVRQNFLGARNPKNDYAPCVWPCGSEGAFALLGNHEMYARGQAYFDHMLPALGLRGRGGQLASYFCLENEFWRIVGLDTGYNSIRWPLLEPLFGPDCALPAQLLDWLKHIKLGKDNRGIILLSHHQYYSKYDRCYPKAAVQLSEMITRPVLWFWGHEHRLVIYKEFGLQGGVRAYGRCIGHGGMPVEFPLPRPKRVDCPVEFQDERLYFNNEDLRLGMNGFARLWFRGNTLRVEYVDLHGHVVFCEQWVTENGEVKRTHNSKEPVPQFVRAV